MNRRTFLTGGMIAAAGLLLGACKGYRKGYRKVDDPDPANWLQRDRDQEWMEDKENFPDPEPRSQRGADDPARGRA
jgi:hypothetical protein